MKKNLFYILLLFCTKFIAQTNDYKLLIDGHVFDSRLKTTASNVKVKLVCDNDYSFVCNSDPKGYYFFKFTTVSFKTGTISINNGKPDHRDSLPTSCRTSDGKGYFFVKQDELPKHIVKDFEIAEDAKMIRMPYLLFKKNSIVLDTIREEFKSPQDSDYCFPKHILRMLANTFAENPTIVVQLSAHCSADEANPAVLSQKRADKVKEEFIKLGIPKGRLLTKGYGISRLLIKDDEILQTAKDKKEKDYMRSRNRRCVLSIVSWDYGVEPSKAKDKTSDEEE